jgi:hypothetical protein
MSHSSVVIDDALEPIEVFPVFLIPLARGHAAKMLADTLWWFGHKRQPNHAITAQRALRGLFFGRGHYARSLWAAVRMVLA